MSHWPYALEGICGVGGGFGGGLAQETSEINRLFLWGCQRIQETSMPLDWGAIRTTPHKQAAPYKKKGSCWGDGQTPAYHN